MDQNDLKTKTNTPLRTNIEKEKMYYEYYKIFWNYNEDSYKELCWETRDAKLRLEELNIHECCVCQEDKSLGKLSCGHQMCVQCSISWFRNNKKQTCPYCRAYPPVSEYERYRQLGEVQWGSDVEYVDTCKSGLV